MRALLIKDGVVINAIVVDDLDAFLQEADPNFVNAYDAVVESENVPGAPGLGWLYDGHDLSPPKDQDA